MKVMCEAERFMQGLPEATPEERKANEEEAELKTRQFIVRRQAPWQRKVHA